MKKYMLLMFFLLVPLNVNAKEELDIKCDQYTFKEFEEFTCRTSVNSSFEFNKITFELDLSKGISIDEVRSNYTNLWILTIDKNKVTAETKNGVLVSGLQEFGIMLFGTMEYGTQKINLKNISLVNTNQNETLDIENISKDIKILSSENKLKNIYIDGKKIEKFNSNIFHYLVDINKSTKVNITADLIDENSTISGIGEIEIESVHQVTIVPVSIKSEAGVNRVYYIHLVRSDIKESQIFISSIELKDNKNNIIDFNFNPNIYEYNLEVDPKITSLTLDIKLDDSDLSLVKNYGNRTVNIEDGDNPILIKIKNSNGEVKTYIFNITKLLSNKSANCYLKTLSINKYDLRFNKKVKIYKLAIKKADKKLDIIALPEDSKSTVNIIGNEDLKTGSIVKVVVKAENGSSFTYQMQITNQKSSLIQYLTFIAVMVIIFGIANELFRRYRGKSSVKKVSDKKAEIVKEENKKIEKVGTKKSPSKAKAVNDNVTKKSTPVKKKNSSKKKPPKKRKNTQKKKKKKSKK